MRMFAKIENKKTPHTFAIHTACPDPSGSQRSDQKLQKSMSQFTTSPYILYTNHKGVS